MTQTKHIALLQKAPELSEKQQEILRNLLIEAEEGQGTSSRKGISSSFQLIQPAIIGESDHNLANADLHAVQYRILLEGWRRGLGVSANQLVPLKPKPVLPAQLGPFRWDPITFDNGVPVGGWAEVTIFQDGSASFSGNFHDSGAPSYNSNIVWAFKDTTTNIAYTVQHTGHMAGTFESGSRDDGWNNTSAPNAQLAAAWPTFSSNWAYNVQAQMNGDFNAIIGEALSGLGTVLGVVALFI